MNTLVLSCLLCFVCSALGVLGSEVTFSSGLSHVTGGPASGEGLHSSLSEDEELEVDEDLSVGVNTIYTPHGLSKDEKRKRKGKGKRRNKHRSKSTTALNPEHTYYASGYTPGVTSSRTTTEDPCTSSHLSFCIHGFCKYMEGLQEPVCICMKGYDGKRCGIQLLETGRNGEEEERRGAEVVQTVMVIIAVVLSIISCIAILLMTCAHYRTHKNFLAAYLGTGMEEEKLQKPLSDIMV